MNIPAVFNRGAIERDKWITRHRFTGAGNSIIPQIETAR
jgi:hypothetical protein